MTNFVYDDRFLYVAGTPIDGGDWQDLFDDIETAIQSKANLDGQTYTGTHTFPAAVFTGTLDATAVATALFAAISATSVTASGAISGLTLAGLADATTIDGGTWS